MKKRLSSAGLSPQGLRSTSPTSPSTSVADPKLLHLVRKLVLSSSVGDEAPSIDVVVNSLRNQYREYQRKDLVWMKRNVDRALQVILSNTNQQQQQQRRPSNSKKRSLEQAADSEEDRLELEAQESDAIREQLAGRGSSMLNASLQKRYRQVQQERDEAARSAAAALGEGNNNGEEGGADVSSDNGENKQQQKPRGEMPPLSSEPSTPTAASQKTKRLRRKKSGLGGRSSSSVENGLPPMPGGEASHTTPVPRPQERYSDLGGLSDVLQQIRQLVEYPLVRPELYRHLGVDPPRGVLLRGPPGCGKTHLANAIAGQLGLPYFRVSAPELVSAMSGESEGRIRDLFRAASESAPSLIFMDELDAIAPKRSDSAGGRGMEKRMVAQLLTSLDSIDPQYNRQNAPVLVLGATNRPDAMDPALRRAGRFDKEIALGVPDEEAREGILKSMTKGMRLSGDFNFQILARKTPGFVGADVKSLTKEAAVIAINRIFQNVLTDQGVVSSTDNIDKVTNNKETDDAPTTGIGSVTPLTAEQMEPLYVTMSDFLQAIPLVQPSSKREGFATVPDVTWDDIGALQSVREELSLSVLEPIRNPEKFKALGLPLPAGVMLYGPPGCGKTLLAKAISNESGANFISVKGPELLDKYVGESERAVRVVFERARSSSPCVVFFDEMDSLCPKRGSDNGGGGGVSERVVNQLLTEMDGLDSRRSIFVIAATNRPELIDPAMMRPGRLDKLVYVPVPNADDRVSILKALAGKIKLGPDVSLDEIGRNPRAEGYSGADCAALLREAGLAVLKESQQNGEIPMHISSSHFHYAFDHVMPSVSRKDQARYDRMRDRMARARTRGGVADENPKENGENKSSGVTPAKPDASLERKLLPN